MRPIAFCLGLAALSSMAVGCVDASGGEGESEEEVGAAASPQLDPGFRTYTIKQGGVIVAAAWAGTITGGAVVEYWASKPSYSPSAGRTFDGAAQSCASFKRTVCGTSWSGATYRKGIFTQQPLNCSLPPGPCSPPPNTSSFLAAGSYRTTDASGAAFGWTFSDGTCEHWAMHHTIGAGQSSQNPLSSGYSSQSSFITAMCTMSPIPTTYFEATYEDLANACTAIVC